MQQRYNPFEEVEKIFNRMAQQFESVSGSLESGEGIDLMAPFEPMPIDVEDHNDEIVVSADLPGFQTDDVSVEMTESHLRILAERDESMEEADEDKEGRYIRRERRKRSLKRSIKLPSTVEEAEVDASMSNGVLTVRLPKRVEDEGHEIEIESA